MQCPNCGSSDHNHIVWGPRNLAVVGLNILYCALQAVFVVVDTDGFALKRRCLDCGYLFHGPVRERPDFDACAKCGYDLTGNVSGRCPECGWVLPRRYRAHRRRTDRASRRGAEDRSGETRTFKPDG